MGRLDHGDAHQRRRVAKIANLRGDSSEGLNRRGIGRGISPDEMDSLNFGSARGKPSFFPPSGRILEFARVIVINRNEGSRRLRLTETAPSSGLQTRDEAPSPDGRRFLFFQPNKRS